MIFARAGKRRYEKFSTSCSFKNLHNCLQKKWLPLLLYGAMGEYMRLTKIFLYLNIVLATWPIFAAIRVTNEAFIDLYAALFKKQSKERLCEPLLLSAHSTTEFLENSDYALSEQEIVVSLSHSLLKNNSIETLTITSLDSWETDFHCTILKGKLILCPESKWQSWYQYIENKWDGLDAHYMNELRSRFVDKSFCSRESQIRMGTSLPKEELSYLKERSRNVKTGLEKLLKSTLNDNQPLRIGIAGSGGGFRALLNMLGSLLAAEQTGLLDCISYASGVSGSTWMLASWISSGVTIDRLQQTIVKQLTKSLLESKLDLPICVNTLLSKKAFDEPLSLVDTFGLLLTADFLANFADPEQLYLHDQAARIAQGTMPCPLYSVIIDSDPYQWVECSPFEIGSDYLGTFIPSWAIGRSFINGSSINFEIPPNGLFAPPLPLGYLMAIWGSAFAAVIAPNLAELAKNIPYIKDFMAVEPTHLLSDFIPAQVNNWNYQLTDAPLQDAPYLTLMDGGIFINFDLNSLLRRQCDIIIILDASSDVAELTDLKNAVAYFGKKFTLPSISFEGTAKRTVSVLNHQIHLFLRSFICRRSKMLIFLLIQQAA